MENGLQEATAVLLALHLFRDVLCRLEIHRLEIVVDNTSVRDTLSKGSSKAEALNRIIVLTINLLKELGCRVTISYIPSSLNPSDSISRGTIPNWVTFPDELATWLDWRQGEGGSGVRSRVLL